MLSELKLPPPKRQLEIETDKYESLIKQYEQEGRKAEDTSIFWNEVETRKALFDQLVGRRYIPPLEVTEVEKRSLLRIFQSTEGHSWSKNQGWIGQQKVLKKPEIPPFEAKTGVFEGVSVSSIKFGQNVKASVVGLNFSGIGCDGPIPNEICHLTNCEYFDLSLNLISGELPLQLGKLTGMRRLSLRGNKIEGSLNGHIFSNFKGLTELDLSFNRFQGPVPDCFESTPQLTDLNLSGNQFSGELPSSLSLLVKLRVLKAYQNKLSSVLPEWFVKLTKLRELNLSQNKLTGGLMNLHSSNRLEKLILNDNALEDEFGSINWSLFSSLDTLYLQHNKLHGTITDEVTSLVKLRRLNLSFNCLTGVLPQRIGNLIQLETLILTGNEIVGPVPISLGTLSKLRDFHIFKDYPSETTFYPRGFRRKAFERVYVYGPSANLNSVCWDPNQLYGEDEESTVTVFVEPTLDSSSHGARSLNF